MRSPDSITSTTGASARSDECLTEKSSTSGSPAPIISLSLVDAGSSVKASIQCGNVTAEKGQIAMGGAVTPSNTQHDQGQAEPVAIVAGSENASWVEDVYGRVFLDEQFVEPWDA